jgi:SulP family sulfate permease
MNNVLQPKLIQLFREGYSLSRFLKDLTAGIVVGIVALPLAIAFGIASGCTPQQGLITAIVAGFIISLLSGSRVQIGGPTGAFVVLVGSVVHQFGYEGLVVATVMAGILLVIMGIAKMGKLIEFIPYPVTVGFTTGIAAIIAFGQIPNALGFIFEEQPEFIGAKALLYVQSLGEINWYAPVITLGTMLIVVGMRKISQRVPGAIIAILLFSLISYFFKLPLETIGDRFGVITGALPSFSVPEVNLKLIATLLPSAIAIALLGGIESLLSAVVADGMTGYRHRSNMELIAQGAANIITPLLGGIPATGAIARTATNIKNGGHTPIAGIVHSFTLLIIVLAASKLVGFIPFAVLAGILFGVAYNMAELHLFKKILKSSKSDATVLVVTFLLTVLIDLVVAIEVGMVLAAFLFMKRMIDVTSMKFNDDEEEEILPSELQESVELFEINGPFFFGAASRFAQVLKEIPKHKDHLILRMRNVPAMDVTALKALEDTVAFCKTHGIDVILAEVQDQPRSIIERSSLSEIPLVSSLDMAIAKARDGEK